MVITLTGRGSIVLRRMFDFFVFVHAYASPCHADGEMLAVHGTDARAAGVQFPLGVIGNGALCFARYTIRREILAPHVI